MRNKTIALLAIMVFATEAAAQELIITGVIDGPLSGGIPKAVELYVVSDVDDLSIFGVGSANNGGGSDGEEFTFPAVAATAGDFIYVATEATGFTSFFGFAPDYLSSTAASINGDDAIELFKNGAVADVFGDINVDGTGEPWEYLDGWAYRVSGTGPDGSAFVIGNWNFSGPNALDGETTNGGAATPFPIGTYTTTEAGPVLLINELDADTPGSDSLEFVELYDGGAGNTPLDGLVVVFYNGSDDASYNDSFDLDGYTTDADGYFLLGNPLVVPTPAIVFPGNGLQNGADAVALHQGDAIDFPNDTQVSTTGLLDAVVYDTNDGDDAGLLVLLNAGQPQVNEGGAGDKDNHSNQRCPNGSGGARNTSSFAQYAPTPGAENVCVAPVEQVFIHEVQGNGAASPLVGTTVAIEGIVVGDFQDTVGSNGDLNGFFLQEEDVDADGDPMTSEGIFVFNGSNPDVDVQIGDLVAVEGGVSEFFGMTQITSFDGVQVLSSGQSLPTAASLSLPVSSIDDFEPYEGMYVTFPQALVITEYFNFDRFGDIVLSSKRLLQPTAVVEPGPAANDAAAANALDQLTLDDGRMSQNPDPAIHPNGAEFDLDNLFRGGDSVQNVTGVLNYSFGLYRVQPTIGANYSPDNPRTASPDAVGGGISVASFNVLNYFTTIDEGPDVCGPLGDQGCRGADNEDELQRQRAKLVAALSAVDADVVGLIEIENDTDDAALADLVAGLNDATGAGSYAYIATNAIGDDVIRVALIYQPASVTPVGGFAILDGSVDPRFDSDLNRVVLAQSFQDNSRGGIVTVSVAHLKSKGANCDAVGDPDTGDGQGNCNLTRTNAVEALVDWLETDPTDSGFDNHLVIGDMNSYDKEDPIDAFVAGGYTDLVYEFQGEDAYSFLFGAAIGYLDHSLASAALNPLVTGTTVWHINADEPDLIDYDTSFKQAAQDAIYAPDPYRSSDHDPVIVGLDVCEVTPPGFDKLSVTPELLWPPNHKMVDVEATVIASDNFDPSPTVTLISVMSNEPDNGKGDGNTTNDIVIVDDTSFRLRAERSGRGKGRIYTITYQVADDCGNTATDSVDVLVPHSRRK